MVILTNAYLFTNNSAAHIRPVKPEVMTTNDITTYANMVPATTIATLLQEIIVKIRKVRSQCNDTSITTK